MYELNATPGNAIVALASFADHINCCFEGLDRYLPPTKVVHADYPIRYNSSQITTNPEDARTALNLDPHKPTITILGGSQGSHFINTIMAKIISSDHNYWQGIQVIHQTGHNQVSAVQEMYTEHNIAAYVFDYSPNLSAMYAAADIIIARAGAGSIFEAKAFKKRCILIPLETHSTDHQLLNAQSITDQYKQLFSFFKQGELIDNPLLLTHLIKSVLKRS